MIGAFGAMIVWLALAVQPFASLIFTVYVDVPKEVNTDVDV
jgi:hypothetical protein